jgi:hypothetical protein
LASKRRAQCPIPIYPAEKNGTPEQRSAKAGPAIERGRKQRRSKNGTPEERAAKQQSAQIVHIVPRRDLRALPRPMTTEEFADAISRLGPWEMQAIKATMDEMVQSPPGPAA